MVWFKTIVVSCVLATIGTLGCDNTSQPKGSDNGSAERTTAVPATQAVIPQVQMFDWCREHGVPESVCTRCNPSLVAQFKDKKDWCEEHGLPESQCFVCHPELKQQFADQYKAKYGKEPPATSPST